MAHALRFYGDESGSHGKGTFVIAGYLATEYNWEQFNLDWNAALAETPGIPFFHRERNYRGKTPFDGWTEQAREDKLKRMIRVFERFGGNIVELSSTVAWDEYRAVMDGPLAEIISNPYYLCQLGVISLAVDWVRRKSVEESGISFVFDYQFQHQAEAVRQFTDIVKQLPPEFAKYLSGICFMDDQKTAGLQAADLIAWQVRRDYARLPEDRGQTRPELELLRKGIYKEAAQSRKWNASGIAQLVANFDVIPENPKPPVIE